ncbi:MAG: hypothetical protein L0271_26145, partial [Gemmatimonadetes bacterium]|nr:hypothetical protein [Gemmatimonadota bacterium]
ARRELEAVLARPSLAELPCVTTGRVHAFDGVGLFARPGPRIVESLELLADVVTRNSQPVTRNYLAFR